MAVRLTTLAGPIAAAALAGLAGLAAPPPALAAASPSAAPASKAITGYKTVGKFFVQALGTTFSCTASVVGPDIIVTAAHCFKGEISGIKYTTGHWTFAPMWHDNKFPYGKWSVKAVYLARNWITTLNPRYDYAVVVLNGRAGHDVAHYTGRDKWNARLTLRPGQSKPVRIVGIPMSGRKALVNVTRAVAVDVGSRFEVLRASTPGFSDGTSGGPWFYPFNPKTDTGTIIGVTGGYEAGGATDSPSYADFLTGQFARLMAAATKGIRHCDHAGDCRYWPS